MITNNNTNTNNNNTNNNNNNNTHLLVMSCEIFRMEFFFFEWWLHTLVSFLVTNWLKPYGTTIVTIKREKCTMFTFHSIISTLNCYLMPKTLHNTIIHSREKGQKNAVITKNLCVTKMAVHRTVERYQEMCTVKDSPRSGRSRSVNTSRIRKMVKKKIL
uniref:HTH_Tnp_Tc3_1 domain-containing protein n=1 Tax=Heterorhabditis bacteriophora TaxID=37862 RepID=A0A1I7WLF6_HETBA